ncbi:polyketide cyclase / dehydrase and lipid transport [Mycobacterium sp. 1165196.3]|uniref:SRPBCC family protein n=1 Tax=unclassified Mycobacterium TaxID=2642494 RepID=UPI0007FCC05B|nr:MULTISPECIES: SRPBCC family protein [unclassified Mycobacterium]OBJ22710.1 polyketide cyclase / dehydrase and lipid transport [Mycobacterium sp. 1245801.1]OBK04085.1 polyketide cyclase / dehydrase and lipid transport [Mycobacterium sp. 1245852.3]OBK31034.1 polyketide cyclase / dehydrase and lipid transport [Mycobacterium sp. 1165196.3]
MTLHSRARSLVFVHADRTLSEHVPAPPDAVRGFYVDLDNIKLVHPLIVSVETVSRSETPDGYQQAYRVVDRIPLGPFTIRTGYHARLRVPVSGDVLTEADQSPGVRLRGTVSFDPVDGGTRITERISITAPRLLAGVTIREAVKAHVKMLAGIRGHFESG